MAQKELNKLKEQLRNAENTKTEALVQLDKANTTVENIIQRLNILNASKEAAIQSTEAAKLHAKQLQDASSGNDVVTNGFHQQESGCSKEEYAIVISELIAAKKEVAKIRQDYDTLLEAKVTATKQVVEAEQAAKANKHRAAELESEISSLKETIEQVKRAMVSAQQDYANILSEKDVKKQSYKTRLEESEKQLQQMKKEFDPYVGKDLKAKLTEAMSEIEALKNEVENAKSSDVDAVRSVTLELDVAKESLQKVLEEGGAFRTLVNSMKDELDKLRKEQIELKEKEAETESVTRNLNVNLSKCKSELEASLEAEAKASEASNEMIATLNQLKKEAANGRCEAKEMNSKCEELRKEAHSIRLCLEEAEHKLNAALKEAEEAKAQDARALAEMEALSEQNDGGRTETGGRITISRDEFEATKTKAEEKEKLGEMKVKVAMAEVEALKESEEEALERIKAVEKEIQEMKAATEEALKKAEMYEAAKKAVESELRKWREQEIEKAAQQPVKETHNYLI